MAYECCNDESSDDGGDDLGQEHDAGRGLHAMASLKIAHECDALRPGDKAEGLEECDGNGTVRGRAPRNSLRERVDRHELIGHGADDADGGDENESDSNGEDR